MTYEVAIKKVLEMYGISYGRIYDPQKGYRNEIWPVQTASGQMINVTFHKREAGSLERMQRADTVSTYLAEAGFPTRRRIDARTLQLQTASGPTQIAVYTYLPGATIPWEAYTMTHLKLLGKSMSDMHTSLGALKLSDLPSVYDEYQSIIQRMKLYFSQPTVAEAMKLKLFVQVEVEVLQAFSKLLEQYKSLPSKQPLHMDFVRGNLLFQDADTDTPMRLKGIVVSGILDFEKTALGHPAMDIARTLAFLYVDCKYKPAEKVYKYFMLSGYQKRGKRTDETDSETLEMLVDMFLLYDFYKFLRHNPYESLASNGHYVRTRDMLRLRNVIRY